MRVLVVLAMLAVSAGTARGDDLDRAKALEAALEYEQALAVVDGILAKGGADPTRLVELELFAGRLAGGLDRAAVAEAHFARALAVQPTAALPDGSSPKITGPFAAARARARPLRISVGRSATAVEIDLDDPAGLVHALEVTVTGAGGAVRVERPALVAAHVALRDGETPGAIVALDDRGNRLWVGAAPPRLPTTTTPIPPRRRSLVARPATWLVVAAAGLAAGGLAGWRFHTAQSDFDRRRDEGGHDFSELEALERTGRRWAIAADVGFGVAIAAGVVSGILYLRRPPARRDAVTWRFTGTGVAARF